MEALKEISFENEILLSIKYDKDEESILIIDKFNNSITMGSEGITLCDKTGNSIILNNDGISLDSMKDIVIKATNDISLSAVNIDIKNSSDCNISANNISTKANMTYSASGGAATELKSSGNITIEGAMIAIN